MGKLEMDIDGKLPGSELLKKVCQELGVQQEWYFGLQYEGKGGRVKWIRSHKKIEDQLKGRRRGLFFLAKYSPEEISDLWDEASRSLIYEQTKKEVLAATVECSPEVAILLASFALQADKGDYSAAEYEGLDLTRVVPRRTVEGSRLTEAIWMESVALWHKEHRGTSSDRAKLEYLKVARALPSFGVHYFLVESSLQKTWLGVTPSGLNLYPLHNTLTPFTSLKWLFIRSVRHSAKKFIVTLVFRRMPDYTFITSSHSMAKQIFRLCVGYHNIHEKRYRDARVTSSTQTTETEVTSPRPTCKPPDDAEDDNSYQSRQQYRSDSFLIERLPTLTEEQEHHLV